jgi:hypothetical protein
MSDRIEWQPPRAEKVESAADLLRNEALLGAAASVVTSGLWSTTIHLHKLSLDDTLFSSWAPKFTGAHPGNGLIYLNASETKLAISHTASPLTRYYLNNCSPAAELVRHNLPGYNAANKLVDVSRQAGYGHYLNEAERRLWNSPSFFSNLSRARQCQEAIHEPVMNRVGRGFAKAAVQGAVIAGAIYGIDHAANAEVTRAFGEDSLLAKLTEPGIVPAVLTTGAIIAHSNWRARALAGAITYGLSKLGTYAAQSAFDRHSPGYMPQRNENLLAR